MRPMDHAPVASAYLIGTAAGRGRGPRMATFGQPSIEQVMSPALRKTITATMPGMVSAAESGPPTRRSRSAQRGTGCEPGLTATAGRTDGRPSAMEPPTTAIAATPTTAPRAATPRRAGRPVTSVSGAAAVSRAVSAALAVSAWHAGRSGLRHASWTPSDISRVLVPAARIRHSGAFIVPLRGLIPVTTWPLGGHRSLRAGQIFLPTGLKPSWAREVLVGTSPARVSRSLVSSAGQPRPRVSARCGGVCRGRRACRR